MMRLGKKTSKIYQACFDGRDNMEIVEFVGNTTPPPGDIMRVLVEAPRSTGYDVMQDSDAKNLPHGVSIIQGGVE